MAKFTGKDLDEANARVNAQGIERFGGGDFDSDIASDYATKKSRTLLNPKQSATDAKNIRAYNAVEQDRNIIRDALGISATDNNRAQRRGEKWSSHDMNTDVPHPMTKKGQNH